MTMFEEFVYRKEARKFDADLEQAIEGYEGLTRQKYGEIDKLIINKDAEDTIVFIAGLNGNEIAGPYGVLAFLEKQVYIPKNKKTIIIPLLNKADFQKRKPTPKDTQFLSENLEDECLDLWNALKEEKIDLLVTLREANSHYASLHCHQYNDLALSVEEVAKEHFETAQRPYVRLGTIEDRLYDYDVPFLRVETPITGLLSKRVECMVGAMKKAIHHPLSL